MPTTDATNCPRCGYANTPQDDACSMCGELLRARFTPAQGGPRAVRAAEIVHDRILPPARPPRRRVPESVVPLLVGLPVAFLFSELGPGLLSRMGWFLSALVHETGHAAAAWFTGMPSIPAIRLDGHAAAVASEQVGWLAIGMWAGLGILAWRLRGSKPLAMALTGAAAVYPLLAFTGLREYFHLAAGHLGELVFATVFLWRAITGGFVGKPGERPLYAALGWLWVGTNLFLFGSLVISESSRQWYLTNGSFGLENDFVRIARRLGTSLPVAAFPMLVLSLLPLPAALWLARLTGHHPQTVADADPISTGRRSAPSR